MTEEYGSPGLREKIIAIICAEWSKSPDNILEVIRIKERLESEGVEFSESVLEGTLLQLANHGDITFAIGTTPPPSAGMSIHHVSPRLCQ
jgi:hypothetical protein